MSGTQFTSIYPDQESDLAALGLAGGGPQINEQYPGLPPGAVPDERDITITAAGTFDLWTVAPDEVLVITSAYISTDTAQRVAIVAGSDAQGSRVAVQYAAANGGSSPNLVPAPYEFDTPGTPARVVVATGGNTFVRVSGYIKP